MHPQSAPNLICYMMSLHVFSSSMNTIVFPKINNNIHHTLTACEGKLIKCMCLCDGHDTGNVAISYELLDNFTTGRHRYARYFPMYQCVLMNCTRQFKNPTLTKLWLHQYSFHVPSHQIAIFRPSKGNTVR